MNIPINILVIISVVLAIFISCLSVMKLRRVMLKDNEAKSLFREFLVIIIAFCTIFNFMYIENLYFMEAAIMALAVYLSFIAAEQLVVLDNKKFLKSLLYLLLAVFCYNGAISVYVATISMLLVVNKKCDIGNSLKIVLTAGFFCILVLVINLIQIKVVCQFLNLSQKRVNGLESIMFNFQYVVLNWWKVLVVNGELFPKYLFLLFLVGIFAICFLTKKDIEKIFIEKIFLFSLISIFSSFALYLFTLSSFGTGRLHTNIGMLIGYLFIIIYTNTSILEGKKISKYCMMILIVCYLVINIINNFVITRNHKEINKIEELKVAEISEYIDVYEKENNIQIKYVAMKYIRGQSEKAFYKRQTSVNCIGLYGEASFDGIINFYTGRNLERIYLTEDLNQQYMKQIEGKEPSVQCVGDVLICVVYVV